MYINYNGKIVAGGQPVISTSNRSFRYGDGCFETMRVFEGNIILKEFHFERVFFSLEQLQFDLPKHFTPAFLQENIATVLRKNKLVNARVRLTLFRGNGGLYDPENLQPNFVIECYSLPNKFALNENGLVVDFFRDSIKASDNFSSIKSNNFLPYVMAALLAKKNPLNEAVLLNQRGAVADTTIANLFIVSNGKILTPAIDEAPVAGVMRRYLLNSFRKDGLPIEETVVTLEDLLNASEVFSTNAIRGIQWVKQCGKSGYTHDYVRHLFATYIGPLCR